MARCNNCKNLETKDNGFDAYSWCEKINDCPHEDIERDCEHYAPMTNADRIRSMTENEAIDKMKNMRLFMQIEDNKNECKFTEDDYAANKMALQALEEVQQYRQIGTVEECREAVEKQTAIEPEKVNIPCTSWTKAHMRYRCSCGSFLTSYDDYCNKCGQKLKWGDGK